MTNAAEKEAGIKVSRSGKVTNGPDCPGVIARENPVACDREAVYVVEDRTMYKCDYGHRWRRLT